MVAFIRTVGGNWINANRIDRAVFDKGECRHQKRFVLYGPDNEKLGEASPYDFDPEYQSATYVPAFGVVATVISVLAGEERPTAENIHVSRLQVIAWRLLGYGYSEPVLIEKVYEKNNTVVFIECPDGAYSAPEDVWCLTLDAAKQHVLEQAIKEWEDNHQPENQASPPALVDNS